MVNRKNDRRKLIFSLLTLFGIVITLNYTLIRYPGDILITLLKTALIFSVFLVYGFSINFLFEKKESELPEALATGIIFATFYFFLFGSLKLLIPGFIILFFLLPVPILFFLILKKRDELTSGLRSFFIRPPSEFGIFIFPFIYASLPSSFYDTLVYHLGIPNLYLLHRGFIETPQMIYANTSIYYEVSLIPSLFAGSLVPRIFHFLIGMVFCLSLVDTAVRFFNLKRRSLFLVLLVSIPITFFLLTTVKNDLAGAFFILAGIRSHLKGKRALSAVYWGFSIGVKYFNIIPLGIFLFMVLIKNGFKKHSENFKLISTYGIISFLMLLPLFIKNYILVKNPFFPFFTGYFKQEYFDISRYKIMKNDVGALLHSFKSLLTLPYDLSFREIGSGGLLGVQFLVFLPFIILKRKINSLFLLNFSLILIVTGAFFTSSIRFLYIAVAILALYTMLIFEDLETVNFKTIKILFFLLIALNIITTFGYQERIYRAYYLYSGKMSAEEYKTTLLPTYPAISYINNKTPADSTILVVGDTRNFYLRRRYFVSSAIDYSILKRYLDSSATQEDFFRSLRSSGVNFILFNSSEFKRLNRIYKRLDRNEAGKFTRFIKFLDPVFRKGFAFVYKVPERE